MVKSMYAAVAGLKTHQAKLDVIGNNIANVNTYGYKKERASFADTYYATSQAASEATAATGGLNPTQVGYGVQMAAVNNIVTTGGAAITDNPTDVMITGNGYFLVGAFNQEGYTKLSNESGTGEMGSLTDLNLTRVGLFNFDGQGSFVDVNANYVYGFSSIRGIQAIKDLEPQGGADGDNMWRYTVPAENEGEEPEIYTVSAVLANDEVTVVRYDVYRGEYTAGGEDIPIMTMKAADFDPDTADCIYVLPEGGEYSDATKYTADQKTGYVKSISSGVVATREDQLNTIQMPRVYTVSGYFDQYGNPLTATLYDKNDTTRVYAYAQVQDPETGAVRYERITEENRNNPEINAGDIDIPVVISGEEYWDVSISMELNSIAVGADGVVSGVNANNTVLSIGRIAVANVPNPVALESQGNNYYRAKANTGVIEAFNPGDGATGSLASGTLEMSNVDLSTEFTDMITTQRGYQANARIITVTDSMLEELVNLKRG